MTRVRFDPNVRVGQRGTFVGFEDVVGESAISVNSVVELFEPESQIYGTGRVTSIDLERELIYLDVDWSRLAQRSLAEIAAAVAGDQHEWAKLVSRIGTAAPVRAIATFSANSWGPSANSLGSVYFCSAGEGWFRASSQDSRVLETR